VAHSCDQRTGHRQAACFGEVQTRKPIQDEVGQEMQAAIKEGEQAEHAPELDRAIPAADAPQRRHGQRKAEKA